MTYGKNANALLALLILMFVFKTHSASVLISQVLKGRLFGTPESDDIPKRIVVGEDGSLYVAGSTAPGKPGAKPWGDAETGERTGKKDVFLAKFSGSGQLTWIKRTGSPENDTVNDLKVTRSGIYVCGSTEGKFGIPSQGSSDAYLMKFSLSGFKLWRHPFQFGSRGYDSCHSLHVDSRNKTLFVTGNTSGQMFGNVLPGKGTLHYFVAIFKELTNDPLGLKLIKGRQQGSYGSCSGDGIVVLRNRLFVMSSNWDEHWDKKRTETYLNVLDPSSLFLEKLHVLKIKDGTGFYGIRMVSVNATGEVFVVGVASESQTSHSYRVLKFSLSLNRGKGGLEWAKQVGTVSAKAHMVHQIPSIAIDPSQNMVYVAGVEDGFFTNTTDGSSGLVSVPFLKLDMKDGHKNETWHRITTVPFEKEELTDIALQPGRPVVYTGVWDGGAELHLNTMVGSFGSKELSSRSIGSKPVESAVSAEADKAEKMPMSKGKIAGYVLLSLAGVGVLFSVLFVRHVRSKRGIGLEVDESSEFSDSETGEMEEVRRQVAESHRDTGFSQAEANDVYVGGSADPH